MDTEEHCTVMQLVDGSGALIGPVRLRRVEGGRRLDAHLGETLCQAGLRLQDEGWRLVSGNRIPVRARTRPAALFAVILTYARTARPPTR
jgi:hypothetical protein